jgi:hypothetical protein
MVGLAIPIVDFLDDAHHTIGQSPCGPLPLWLNLAVNAVLALHRSDELVDLPTVLLRMSGR